VDEVRLWGRILGTNEITTRYNNENDPGSFYTIGTVETPP
jgi:hypothetical protein